MVPSQVQPPPPPLPLSLYVNWCPPPPSDRRPSQGGQVLPIGYVYNNRFRVGAYGPPPLTSLLILCFKCLVLCSYADNSTLLLYKGGVDEMRYTQHAPARPTSTKCNNLLQLLDTRALLR